MRYKQEKDIILEEVVFFVEKEEEDAIQGTESSIPIATEATLQASLSSLHDHWVPSAHQRPPLERVDSDSIMMELKRKSWTIPIQEKLSL